MAATSAKNNESDIPAIEKFKVLIFPILLKGSLIININAETIKKLDASRTTLTAKRNERASASYDRNLTEAQRTEKLNNIDVEIKALEASITTDDALVKKEETDIKTAVEQKLIRKTGDKRTAIYCFKK